MARERYIAKCIQHWHVVLIGADGKETVMEITDSEETAKAEAAKLNREAELTYRAEQNMPSQQSGRMTNVPAAPGLAMLMIVLSLRQ
jgi:hypothetical protein